MSLRSHVPRWLKRTIDEVLSCPSCRYQCRTRRTATTLSSNTAINSNRSVPDQYRALYSALGDVRRNAVSHAPFSRLQLALQGLESKTPRIRIAILGLDVPDTARRLVRLLLADPLEAESDWEQELIQGNGRFENGLLIRFGQAANPNLAQASNALPMLEIPAAILERCNTEILVSTVSRPVSAEYRRIPVDTFLAPVLDTPSAFSGRHTIISQPVHRALILANGLSEVFQVAELLAACDFSTKEERAAVQVVMQDQVRTGQEDVIVIDAAKAEAGLAAIRSSLSKATEYEHEWMQSGVPRVSKWMTSVSNPQVSLSQPVADLIAALLQSASTSLKAQAKVDANAQNTDLASLTNLTSAIDGFSRNAHKELQSGLASAWSSRNWRKLAWYKLFWRVDDVGLIVTDLVSNAWLPRTERAVYELSGRLSQAGISPMDMVTTPVEVQKQTLPEPTPATEPVPILQAQSVPSVEQTETVIVNESGAAKIQLQPLPQLTPISASISATRQKQIQRAIDYLTTMAQQLVFRTLSITGLSAGLSGLTYMSLGPGSGIYEAGTIVALATAFALWRMQGGWQHATKAVEAELYDEGRNVIRRVSGRMQQLVVNESRPARLTEADLKARAAARSVEVAQAELQKVLANGKTDIEK